MSKEPRNRDKEEPQKRLLTIREFSKQYGRSRSRTYALISSGELAAVKDGRSTLIPSDAAEDWAKNLKPVSTPSGE